MDNVKGNDLGEDMSWLNAMMDIGYPKGWTGPIDPGESVRERILNGLTADEGYDEYTEEFIVFGDGEDERLQLPPVSSTDSKLNTYETKKSTASEDEINDDSGPSTLNPDSPSTQPQRWADYKTTLFLSQLLPIYSPPKKLPKPLDSQEFFPILLPSQPLSHSASTPELPIIVHCARCVDGDQIHPLDENLPHPWRYPGAFGAFGPVGWSKLYAEADAKRKALGCTCICHSSSSSKAQAGKDEAAARINSYTAKVDEAEAKRDLDEEGQDIDMDLSD